MENDILNKIININKKIEEFAASHNDDDALMDEIKNLCNDNDFKSEEYIIEYFKDKVNLDRTLRVGIVGRVKSGKSSLLNSLLFDGKDILPKAATPMTAALTNIQYSDTNYIEIEFLTKKDIEDLEEIYNRYNKALEKEIENLKRRTISERVTSAVGGIVSTGAKLLSKTKNIKRQDNINYEEYYDYDKFEKDAKEIVDKKEYLKNGNEKYILIKDKIDFVRKELNNEENKRIDFENIEEISDKLKDYVGAEGKFVDFVKSLNIYINIDYLKDLNILDTPGFNDPVETRDAKARELLSKCDVVLILMPANKNFTKSDRDIISKIRNKEGIQEIYIIISMFDDALHSQENIKASEGDLEEAKNIILNGFEGDIGLIGHIKEIFTKMNDENIFDKLLSKINERVIYSSGICHSILKNWDNFKELDDDSKKVIENLSKEYPDYISLEERETSLETLKNLANIESIHKILKDLTVRKNEILGESLNNFYNKFIESAKYIQRKLNRYARERLQYIKSGNINDIEIESKKLEKSINKISKSLKGKFEDSIEKWYKESLEDINKQLGEFFENANDSVKEKTTKEFLIFFKKEYTDKENIKNLIYKYAKDFNSQLEIFILNTYKSFREDLIKNTTKLFVEEELDINMEQLASIIKPIIYEYENNINKYDANPHLEAIESITKKRYLDNKDEDEVVKKANDIIKRMDEYFDKIVREDNLKKFKDKISEIDFADSVLSNYRNRIKKNKEEIENKEKAIDKWNRIRKEIDNLV